MTNSLVGRCVPPLQPSQPPVGLPHQTRRQFLSLATRVVVLLLIASASGSRGAASSAPSTGWASVFVDPDPERDVWLPYFSYNSTGGRIETSRFENTHTVFLEHLTERTPSGFVGGVAHVSAYGKGYCNVVEWHAVSRTDKRGVGTEINVACFDDAGAPTETGIVLTFSNNRSPGATGTLAWLFSDRAGSPRPAYSYNSTGSTNTVSSLGTGVYAVDLPGADLSRGTAHVTAYGPDNGYCNIGNWARRLPGTILEVRCFDRRGVLKDHPFTLSFGANVSLLGTGPTRVTHGFLSDGFSWVPRLGEAEHQYNSAGHTNTVIRAGSPLGRPSFVGSYQLFIGSLVPPGDTPYPLPIAVAYGSNAHCRPVGFSAGLEGLIWVACTMPGGLETDSAFVVQLAR
jgi:hypothetical protein